jgi:hypothetical protein
MPNHRPAIVNDDKIVAAAAHFKKSDRIHFTASFMGNPN